MAIVKWPSQVPFAGPVNGVSAGQSYAAPLVSETEGGPAISRPRPGPRVAEYPWMSPLLSGAEWQAFELFVREDLRHGTLPFEMPVYRPGGCYVSRICQIKDGVWQTDLSLHPRYRVSFTRIVWDL